jgi:signal transduction histidine kinase
VRNVLDGKRGALAGALLTLLPLLGLTLWMWWSADTESTQTARNRFEFKVAEGKFAIQQRLLAYEQVLRGGSALFAASDDVTREEWRTYVGQMNLNLNFPGIQAIAVTQRIPPSQLAAHIRKIRSEGFPDYTVRPPEKRDEYFSIVYIEPFDARNRRAFGFDLMTEPVRREALIRARDTGLPSATGKITLKQETTKDVQHGFLMCMPRFPRGAVPAGLDERRAALVGYICSVFRMNDLMRGIFGVEQLPNIELEIYDGAGASADRLMYDSQEESPGTSQTGSAFAVDQEFEFNGRKWTLRFRSLPAFDATIDVQKPRWILLSGLLVSVLFAAVVWAMAMNRRRARELAAANHELSDAKNAAEAANRAKSHFLANVSHELRTPLTLILAPLEQLLIAPTPIADGRAHLERAQRNAMLLLNRVNDVLDFSKAEAGKSEVRWEAVELAELIPALAGDAAAVAQSKGCSLSWQVDPALGKVCTDRRYFEKILLNFVSNALKFTPAGGSIRVEAVATDDDSFEFSVTDSGIGIPADKQGLLFNRFQQIDASATRQYGGTGIGLALVKELAELMGGSVGVHSEAGKGARFFVHLPRGSDRLDTLPNLSDAEMIQERVRAESALRRVRFQDGSQAPATLAGPVDAPPGPRGPVPCVLIADDNPDMRDYIADLLHEEFKVFTAADGNDAWAQLQGHEVDVVVSDVMMPELDGLALTARIKKSETLSHLPVILVTARGGDEARSSGLDGGADDYIAKPFSPQELRARVRAALRMGQVQRELRAKSREAGMAMVASSILHNLGNVLNGVTVTSSVIEDKLHNSKVIKLNKVAELLQANMRDLPGFFARDTRAQALPEFLVQLSSHLEAEHKALLREVDILRGCAEHAGSVIARQQHLARPGTEQREVVSISGLIQTALKLAAASFDMQNIAIESELTYAGSVVVDRNKVLEILLNLLGNAVNALRDAGSANKRILVRTSSSASGVRIEVNDNGVGIESERLSTLLNQGFTANDGGHGYGLHSSANWAHDLGGTLSCHSEGRGRGATFVLELPLASSTEQTHDKLRSSRSAAA